MNYLLISACLVALAVTIAVRAEDQKAPDAPASRPTTAPAERTTDSGLIIIEVAEGTGPQAVAGDVVSVHYTGKLKNGTQFDSSVGKMPIKFTLGRRQVIPGWDEGIAGMKVGAKRKLIIPPDLAYGAEGAGDVIPPNATLYFDVELVNIGG